MRAPSGDVMQGQLQFASPFELGQFLLLGRKTGALHLTRDGKRGVLYVLEGQIVSAVSPELRSGEEAAAEMIRWTEGDFRFVPEPVMRTGEIEVGTENLLLEVARQMDETGLDEQAVAASLEKVPLFSETLPQ